MLVLVLVLTVLLLLLLLQGVVRGDHHHQAPAHRGRSHVRHGGGARAGEPAKVSGRASAAAS